MIFGVLGSRDSLLVFVCVCVCVYGGGDATCGMFLLGDKAGWFAGRV